MPTVSVRQLADSTSRVVREVCETGRPHIITNRGVPVAAIVPIDPEKLEDFVLDNAPEYVGSMRSADGDFEAGQVQLLDDLVKEAADPYA